jgi:hypothetical protein
MCRKEICREKDWKGMKEATEKEEWADFRDKEL